MSRHHEKNPRKSAQRVEGKAIAARDSGVEPELPLFDYSVDRVDRSNFNEARKKLIDYVAKNFGIAAKIIEKEQHVTFLEPEVPEKTGKDNMYLKIRYTADYNAYRKQLDDYEKDKTKIYGILWGQCTVAMRNQIKAQAGFSPADESKDPLLLWKIIQTISLSGSMNDQLSLKKKADASMRFNRFKQSKIESVGAFYERFQLEYEILQANGGTITNYRKEDVERAFTNPTEKANFLQQVEAETQSLLAMFFIEKLDRTRFGAMFDELQNQLDRGVKDAYPTTLLAAYHMAINRRDGGTYADSLLPQKQDHAAAFTTKGRNKREKGNRSDDSHNQPKKRPRRGKEKNCDDSDQPMTVKCDFCNKLGHERKDCWTFQKAIKMHEQDQQINAESLVTYETSRPTHFNGATVSDCECLAAKKKGLIDPHDVLADTESNVNIFNNSQLLTNIRKTNRVVYINGVFGQAIEVDTVGEYSWFGTVYYHPDAIANILCFYDIKTKFKVGMKEDENHFTVKISPQKTITFVPRGKLYVYSHKPKQCVTLVQTVEDNLKRFTKREIEAAEKAASLYRKVGRPSAVDFEKMISNGSIPNCPVTVSDFRRSQEIWGIDVGTLKGKAVRKTPDHVVVPPAPIRTLTDPITLCMDIFFINTLTFVLAISRKLNLLTVKFIADRKTETVKKAADEIVGIYQQFNLQVSPILCDGEGSLASLKTYFNSKGISLEPTAKNEHVPEIERSGRMVKERIRSYWNTLPFKPPHIVTIYLVYYCTYWINSFPRSSSYDPDVSPREKLTGRKIDPKDCLLEFGEYCQVHEDDRVTNTMKERTMDAIALGPVGNLQHSYYFLNLRTWTVVKRRSWTRLPMPSTVIERLNNRHESEKNKIQLENARFTFENGLEIINTDDSETTDITDTDGDPVSNSTEKETVAIQQQDSEIEEEVPIEEVPVEPLPEIVEEEPINEVPVEPLPEIVEDIPQPVAENPETVEIPPPEPAPELQRYNLRPRRTSWKDRFVTTLTTYSLKQALKKFGTEAKTSIKKELSQLVQKNVFHGVKYSQLSRDQKKKILRSHIFLKRKRDSSLKSRFVANGNQQDPIYSLVDPNSPTVSTEAVFITLAIAGYEKRKIKTVDIVGAYLHADMIGDWYLVIEKTVADLLCEINKEYLEYRNSNGDVLVKLDKALYGCIESARLFYELLSHTLVSLGFIKNEYDECVFNKTVNGHQCTVVVHVDDLLISCVDETVIDSLIAELSRVFGEVNTHSGPVIDYLGMIIDYSNRGVVEISMDAIIDSVIDEMKVVETAVTPATTNLFAASDDSPFLEYDQREKFHSIVAKLLYLAKRGRPDILTAISYLTTRTIKPTTEDWNKLVRVVKYLNGSKSTHLYLSVKDGMIIQSFVDASFAVHHDGKGQTGVSVSLGRGAIYNKSSKQKIVSKSSSESELVALSEGLPIILWTRHFLISQGYEAQPAITYQDNKSTILIAEKGKPSSARTRHINIRYFFVKDRIGANEVKLTYLPTEEMISDFFTKPLQGKQFLKLRDQIMGIKHLATIPKQKKQSSPLK